jgi:uncharacterized membrane protein
LFYILGGILLALAALCVLTLCFFWIVLAIAPGNRYKERAADSRALRLAAEKFARLQAE